MIFVEVVFRPVPGTVSADYDILIIGHLDFPHVDSDRNPRAPLPEADSGTGRFLI
jgi:hypothetical protein